MKSPLLLTPLLLILAACGERSPIQGTWTPDPHQITLTWRLDKDQILEEQGEEMTETKYRSLEEHLVQMDKMIETYGKMGLEVVIGEDNRFTHRRQAGGRTMSGEGTYEFDGTRLILKPGRGDNFLMGREKMDFIFKENRLFQVQPKATDPAGITPKLVLMPRI